MTAAVVLSTFNPVFILSIKGYWSWPNKRIALFADIVKVSLDPEVWTIRSNYPINSRLKVELYIVFIVICICRSFVFHMAVILLLCALRDYIYCPTTLMYAVKRPGDLCPEITVSFCKAFLLPLAVHSARALPDSKDNSSAPEGCIASQSASLHPGSPICQVYKIPGGLRLIIWSTKPIIHPLVFLATKIQFCPKRHLLRNGYSCFWVFEKSSKQGKTNFNQPSDCDTRQPAGEYIQ